MAVSTAPTVGRQAELALIEGTLDALGRGAATRLAIEGEGGIRTPIALVRPVLVVPQEQRHAANAALSSGSGGFCELLAKWPPRPGTP